MFITVSAQANDTFETLARRHLGRSDQAVLLSGANPGLQPPFIGGEAVRVPRSTQNSSANGTDDDIEVFIDGESRKFFTTMEYRTTIDSIDTLVLGSPLTETVRQFRPLSYVPSELFIGGKQLFSGVFLAPTPFRDKNTTSVSMLFYSRCGVLGDCTAPSSLFTRLEVQNQTLEEISNTLCSPFNVRSNFTSSAGGAFDQVAIKRSQKVLPYLIDLANQRGLILTNDAFGDLQYLTSVERGNPVDSLVAGSAPLLSATVRFNPQQVYSELTAVAPVDFGDSGGVYTERSPFGASFLRPHTFDAGDVDASELQIATRNKFGRMLAGAAAYTVKVSTWRNRSGDLWAPNTTITLQDPDIYIDSPYELLIRSVSFLDDNVNRTAVLELVIPEAYTGQIPEALPWQ